jgi:hypothetical protein
VLPGAPFSERFPWHHVSSRHCSSLMLLVIVPPRFAA